MAVITISRGTFSGGESLAQDVAGKLGYHVLPRLELHEAAMRYGVSNEVLSDAISEAPHFMERQNSERARYLACIRAALVRAVKDDNVVYHGLAGHFLLQGVPHVLRVKVIANAEFRIRGAMERTGLNRKETIDYIRKMDEKRAKWTKFLYHVDWNDPLLFDVVINIDRFNISDASEVIVDTVRQERFKKTPETQKIMEDLALSTEVRAMIAMSKGIADSALEVKSDGGAVTVSGIAGTSSDADKIREIARMVTGVRSVEFRTQ